MVRLRLERRRACDATRVRGVVEGAKIASGSARIDADVGAVANAAFAAASLARARSAAPPRPKSAGMCASNAAFAIAAYPRGTLRPEDVVADDAVATLDPASASQHSTQITTAAARTPSKRSAAAECSSASACGNADAGAPAARNVSASVSVARSAACASFPTVATRRMRCGGDVPRVDESPADQKRLSLRATRLRGRFRVHGERRGRERGERGGCATRASSVASRRRRAMRARCAAAASASESSRGNR